VIVATAPVAISLAGIEALSSVPLVKVVGRSEPFQRTTDVVTNPVPTTVRVKACPPAGVEAGSRRVIAGTGFAATIESVTAFDVPPPGAGLTTVTVAVLIAVMSLAGIAAVTWVSLTKLVGRSDPFQRTTEFKTKPVPFTMSVKAGPPAPARFGLIVVIAGTGFALVIVNVTAFEVPPTGAGFDTVTDAVPGDAISLAGIVAVSNVVLVEVVVRSAPFQRTTEPDMKPVPLIVRVNAGPPAVAEPGLSPLIAGTGLLTGKLTALEDPPPGAGLKTVMLEVPPVARSLAGIAAESWLLLTKTVALSDPFHRTTDPPTKLAPFTTRVKGEPPVAAELGLMPLILGVGLLIASVAGVETPPPGAGLETVMLAVPAAVMSLAGIAAVSWVPLPNVVARSDPFQRTTDPLTKLVPATVRVKAGPPAVTEVGLMLEMVGRILLMLKLTAFEAPPPGPGFTTVMLAVLAAAMSPAGIAAVSCVLLPNVVGRSAPFQRTTDPLTKFEPATVRVKAGPPVTAEGGLMLAITGTGLSIAKLAALEAPPPGPGFTTVTLAVPAAAMSLAGIVAVS
jgi:hypothetical protein